MNCLSTSDIMENTVQLSWLHFLNTLTNVIIWRLWSSSLRMATAMCQEIPRFLFENDVLDWKQIYSLRHRVALDTKLREFQYKLLNRCLATNAFLCKIGILSSPACSLCGEADESLELLFVTCHYSVNFWGEVIKWISSPGGGGGTPINFG